MELPEYLGPDNEDMTIEEKKWMFRCRVKDIDVKGNHRWKHQNISCFSCKKNIVKTQSHLSLCEYLIGKNENLTYIPEYDELYSGELEGQIYLARIFKENFEKRLVED